MIVRGKVEKTTSRLVRPRVGLMQRRILSGPVAPEISPGLQGKAAWDHLSARQKGMLEFALRDAGLYYKCGPQDLQWKINKNGGIHIRKRPKIELHSRKGIQCRKRT